MYNFKKVCVIGLLALGFLASVPALSTLPLITQTQPDLDLSYFTRQGYLIATRDAKSGVVSYTANGDFFRAADGYYYQSNTKRLLGYPLSLANACSLIDIKLDFDTMPALATKNIQLVFNLNANAAVPVEKFNRLHITPAMYNFEISTSYIGKDKNYALNLYFAKYSKNLWHVYVLAAEKILTMATLEFSNLGLLNKSSGLTDVPVFDTDNANARITINADESVQFAEANQLYQLKQDGHAQGLLAGATIDEQGQIIKIYNNGVRTPLAKIVFFANDSAS